MNPEALADLHGRVFTVPRPWSAEEFRSLLAGDGCFLIAESEAFLLGRVIADEAEVLTLAVAPQRRRQGAARRLLTGFLAEAGARGAVSAFLEVAADNRGALALYEGAGFTQAGRRRGYFATPDGRVVDALVLARAF